MGREVKRITDVIGMNYLEENKTQSDNVYNLGLRRPRDAQLTNDFGGNLVHHFANNHHKEVFPKLFQNASPDIMPHESPFEIKPKDDKLDTLRVPGSSFIIGTESMVNIKDNKGRSW